MYNNGYFWNTAACSCENSKYTASTGDSVVMSNKIIDTAKSTSIRTILTKTFSTIIQNSNKEK